MKTFSYGRQTIDAQDIRAVTQVLKSPYLTQGPMVEKLEQEICKFTTAKYAVVVSNGTAALHLIMLALGITNQDEGITSPITFMASANSLQYVGCQVKFADIDPTTALIDPLQIKKQLTRHTRVVIPVHYAGQSADMKRIRSLVSSKHIFIVEDAAHALGSYYLSSPVGSCKYSDATIFSFHPVKTITTGEGGAITTNNRQLYYKLLQLRNHGIVRDPNQFLFAKDNNCGPWYHEMQSLGFNYRMPDILAALGVSQFHKLEKFIQKRQSLVNIYRRELSHDPRFTVLKECSYSKAAFHLFPLLFNYSHLSLSKSEIFSRLVNKGLKLQVHYIPVHLQPYYRNLGFKPGDFPHAENYYHRTLSLPLYPSLTQSDIYNIINIVRYVVH